jgi:hypothetical protein
MTIIYKCSYESYRKYLKLRITYMGKVRKFEVRSDKFNVENIWTLVIGPAEVVVLVLVLVVLVVVVVVVEVVVVVVT